MTQAAHWMFASGVETRLRSRFFTVAECECTTRDRPSSEPVISRNSCTTRPEPRIRRFREPSSNIWKTDGPVRSHADAGSLSAAGRALGTPLPTISRRVFELEAQLGTQLLVRTTRRLVLTEAGTAFLASARRLLDDLADAERIAAGSWSRSAASSRRSRIRGTCCCGTAPARRRRGTGAGCCCADTCPRRRGNRRYRTPGRRSPSSLQRSETRAAFLRPDREPPARTLATARRPPPPTWWPASARTPRRRPR